MGMVEREGDGNPPLLWWGKATGGVCWLSEIAVERLKTSTGNENYVFIRS